MKFSHKITTEDFVKSTLNKRHIRKITDDWPIEDEEVKQVIVRHFHSMGIFHVQPFGGNELMTKNLIFLLENSMELKRMVRQAEDTQESNRRKTILSQ